MITKKNRRPRVRPFIWEQTKLSSLQLHRRKIFKREEGRQGKKWVDLFPLLPLHQLFMRINVWKRKKDDRVRGPHFPPGFYSGSSCCDSKECLPHTSSSKHTVIPHTSELCQSVTWIWLVTGVSLSLETWYDRGWKNHIGKKKLAWMYLWHIVRQRKIEKLSRQEQWKECIWMFRIQFKNGQDTYYFKYHSLKTVWNSGRRIGFRINQDCWFWMYGKHSIFLC